jgi:hypothetical protein
MIAKSCSMGLCAKACHEVHDHPDPPPRHVPDRGAHIRQGLSHMLYVPTTPEEVTCSPLPGTNWLPNRPPCPTRLSDRSGAKKDAKASSLLDTHCTCAPI